MAVVRKRSRKPAPDSFATSYLMGSDSGGISITTLKVSEMFLPGLTLFSDMVWGLSGWNDTAFAPGAVRKAVRDFRRTPLAACLHRGFRVKWLRWPIVSRRRGTRKQRSGSTSPMRCASPSVQLTTDGDNEWLVPP